MSPTDPKDTKDTSSDASSEETAPRSRAAAARPQAAPAGDPPTSWKLSFDLPDAQSKTLAQDIERALAVTLKDAAAAELAAQVTERLSKPVKGTKSSPMTQLRMHVSVGGGGQGPVTVELLGDADDPMRITARITHKKSGSSQVAQLT